MATVDWKGFFSNPITYELPQEEFQAAYQTMAAADPNMAEFTEEDHQAFFQTMRQFNPMQPPISEGESELVRQFVAPAAARLSTPGGAEQLIDQEVASDLAGLVPPAAKTLGKAYFWNAVPGLREVARGMGPDEMTQVTSSLMAGSGNIATGIGRLLQQQMDTGQAATPQALKSDVPDAISKFGEEDFPKFIHRAADVVGMTADQILGPEQLKPGTKFKDAFKNPADAADWLGRAFANVAASAGMTAATNMIPVIGPALSAGISWSFVTDELMQAAQAEGIDMSAGEAALRQIPAAALDQIGSRAVAKGLTTGPEQAFKNWFANRLLAFAKPYGEEVATETTQQVTTILNKRHAAGLPLDPYSWKQSEYDEVTETFLTTAAGMVPFGAKSAMTTRTQAENKAIADAIEKKVNAIKAQIAPEEAAAQGQLDLTPVKQPKEEDVRLTYTPEFLTEEEATKFIKKELTPDEVALRLSQEPDVTRRLTPEQVGEKLTQAELEIEKRMMPPSSIPAQPTPEGDEVVRQLGIAMEELAVKAEEMGLPDLAAKRRSAAGQIEVVEPDANLSRGLLGLGKVLGGNPKIVLYRQPQDRKDLRYDGIMVRQGLIGVDVSSSRLVKPQIVVASLLHEFVHNTKLTNPAAYEAGLAILKTLPVWQQSEQRLKRIGAPLTDEEILSGIAQVDNMSTNFLEAMAHYVDVEDIAKAPGPVRAVYEWLAGFMRKAVTAIGWDAKTDGMTLRRLAEVSALRADPKNARQLAQASLAFLDMLRAPQVAQETEVQVGLQEEEEAPVETAAPVVEAPPPASEAPVPSTPTAPERLLAAEIGEEPVEIPFGEEGAKLTVQRDGKGYRVVRHAKTGKVLATKTFPNLKAAKAYINSVAHTKYSLTTEAAQEITSEKTSRHQIPAAFKKIASAWGWVSGTTNADIGGGVSNLHTKALEAQGVKNIVWDPYARPAEAAEAAKQIAASPTDTATNHNVLNVIKEEDALKESIANTHDALKDGGYAYFSVYERNKSGVGEQTRDGWQRNEALSEYIPKIEEVFDSVEVKDGVVRAHKVGTAKYSLSFSEFAESPERTTSEKLVVGRYRIALLEALQGGRKSISAKRANDMIEGVNFLEPNEMIADEKLISKLGDLLGVKVVIAKFSEDPKIQKKIKVLGVSYAGDAVVVSRPRGVDRESFIPPTVLRIAMHEIIHGILTGVQPSVKGAFYSELRKANPALWEIVSKVVASEYSREEWANKPHSMEFRDEVAANMAEHFADGLVKSLMEMNDSGNMPPVIAQQLAESAKDIAAAMMKTGISGRDWMSKFQNIRIFDKATNDVFLNQLLTRAEKPKNKVTAGVMKGHLVNLAMDQVPYQHIKGQVPNPMQLTHVQNAAPGDKNVGTSFVRHSISYFEEEDSPIAKEVAVKIENDEAVPDSLIKRLKNKATRKFVEQFNEIKKHGNWAILPGRIQNNIVIVRLGTLNTPGIEGRRLERSLAAAEGLKTGEATVTIEGFEEGSEPVIVALPKVGRGKDPGIFLNLPAHMPALQDPRPEGLDFPVVLTGNPTINAFIRPHKSWDAVIKVVRVKPVHNGSALTTKAVVGAINYANEIGADILMTYFRSKNLWTLSRFVNFIPTRDESHPDFKKYWKQNKSLPIIEDAKRGDYSKYEPTELTKQLFRDNGWDTHGSIYGGGGTWWWPRYHRLDDTVIAQIDPDTQLEHCDLLHKGCTACRNCQKLTFPNAVGAPIVGLTDEPFCELGCPMCFVKWGQSGTKGRTVLTINTNLKQQGYGSPDLGDKYPITIEIMQRTARDLKNQRKLDAFRRIFTNKEELINMSTALFLDGLITPHEMVQIQNEYLADKAGKTPAERAAFLGAVDVTELTGEGEQVTTLRVPEMDDLTPLVVEHIAASLKDDGKAFFPHDTSREMLHQYFGQVRSTDVGLVASKPRRPQFSMNVDDEIEAPEAPLGAQEVSDSRETHGAQYSQNSGPSWILPGIDIKDWVIKKVADSFIQFKRLTEVLAEQGLTVAERMDVRLHETLYHGKTQEQALRIENKYHQPFLEEMRELHRKRPDIPLQELLNRFDLYLHAVHAHERNKHIREAYRDRVLQNLADKKARLENKIFIVEQRLKDARTKWAKDQAKAELRFLRTVRMPAIEAEIVHVISRPDLDSGMTDEKADGVMKQTRSENLIGPFSHMAKTYIYPMLQERLDSFLREGLITQQEYDNVNRYQWYVPLKGKAVMGDIDDMLEKYHDFGASNGFDIRGDELPPVVGRQPNTLINPITAQAFSDALFASDRIERNRVANAMLEIAETYPNERLWEVNKRVRKRIFDKKSGTIKDVEDWWARNEPNVIAAKRNGETYYIHIYDAGLASAIKGLGVENLGKFFRGLRAVIRLMGRLYTTLSPEFVLTNFTRDWQQAIVSASTDMGKEAAAEVAANAWKAVRGIAAANFPDALGYLKNEYTEFYHELKEEGGKIGFFGMMGVENMQKRLLKELRTGGGVATMRATRHLFHIVEAANESTENGIRLATYVAARKRGASKKEAAQLAKNVTVNFNRRGDWGGAIGAGYLFFNAGVQGVSRFAQSMRSPAGQKLAAVYMGIGFMTSMWARAGMGDDDDDNPLYDKISDFTMGRNWIIPNFVTKKKGDFIQIPMPYGFGIFGQIGKELEHAMFSGDDRSEAAVEAAVHVLTGLTTHFNPLGETNLSGNFYALTRPFIPTILEPWADIAVNESYWGGKIYPAESVWDRRTRSARHYPPKTITEKALVGITEWMNKVTGGTEYRTEAPLLDWNANALSYVLDSYVGPTGRFLKRPFDLVQKKMAGEKTSWNDWIIARRFLSEVMPEYYVPGEFYDAVDDVLRAVDEKDQMKKDNASPEDYAKWAEHHGWKPSLEKPARKVTERIRDIRDRKDGDSKENREKVLELQRAFVSRYLNSEPE